MARPGHPIKTISLSHYMSLSSKRRPTGYITFIKGKVYLVAPRGEWIKQVVASRHPIVLMREDYEEIWGHRNAYM